MEGSADGQGVMITDCLLLKALARPDGLATLGLGDWDVLLPMARKARVHGRLAVILEDRGELEGLPDPVQAHLESARVLARKHWQAASWEIDRIGHALAHLDIPMVLLKGAAYLAAQLPAARGRIYSDTDILVPKDRLGAVEQALLIHGWAPIKLNPYDQRYYRRWMHELPPLRHRRRQTTVDVHHNILPETARVHPSPERLIESSRVIPGSGHWRVLSPEDMILHSATHLFFEGEYEAGIRDLTDLHDLLQFFGDRPGFWVSLVNRATQIQLGRPLFYALRYASYLLDTPIPEACLQAVDPHGPGPMRRRLMDELFVRAMVPEGRGCRQRGRSVAQEMLYIRGHYLRMPLHLLVPHLLHKAIRREQE
jgi:hypothetical protein